MHIRSGSQGAGGREPPPSYTVPQCFHEAIGLLQEEDVALALAEVLDAWRKGTSSKDYTGGLAALAMAFEPASPLHALPASKHQGMPA